MGAQPPDPLCGGGSTPHGGAPFRQFLDPPLLKAIPEKNPQGDGIFSDALQPRTQNWEPHPGQINWQGPPSLGQKNNHGVKTCNLCKRAEPIMQPMPHGSPGSHAVTDFSKRELAFSFSICCRPFVCRSLSVTFVHRTRLKFSAMFLRRLVRWLSVDIHGKFLRRLSQGNVGGVIHKRGSPIERFWTYRTLYLGNRAR